MSTAIAEDIAPTMQRGLSDWWTEETEYVFQRIERWAAFARGYNRLRSQRYSRGRLTMTEESVDPDWNISANKLVVEDGTSWSPRFHNMQRSRRRKSRPEEARINCCGTFNYQSNNPLDSPCLEAYRYDHSIYFKTIGDIRGSDGNRKCSLRRTESPDATSDQEQVEWRAKTTGEIECHRRSIDEDELDEGLCEFFTNREQGATDFAEFPEVEDSQQRLRSTEISQAWPIVDLNQLNLEVDNEMYGNHTVIQINDLDDEEENFNNNDDVGYARDDNCRYDDNENSYYGVAMTKGGGSNLNIVRSNDKSISGTTDVQSLSPKSVHRDQGSKRLIGTRRMRQSPRKVSQPTVVGENNVVWPGVLLNYKKNVDPVYSPHRHTIKK